MNTIPKELVSALMDHVLPMVQKQLDEAYGFKRISKLEPWKMAALIDVMGMYDRVKVKTTAAKMDSALTTAFLIDTFIGVLELPQESLLKEFKYNTQKSLEDAIGRAETRESVKPKW